MGLLTGMITVHSNAIPSKRMQMVMESAMSAIQRRAVVVAGRQFVKFRASAMQTMTVLVMAQITARPLATLSKRIQIATGLAMCATQHPVAAGVDRLLVRWFVRYSKYYFRLGGKNNG
jgi:hypothetical protein